MAPHTMQIFGTWSYWQCGEMAGRAAAHEAPYGSPMPDLDHSCEPDYVAGFEAGWREVTIPVMAYDGLGPTVTLYVAR